MGHLNLTDCLALRQRLGLQSSFKCWLFVWKLLYGEEKAPVPRPACLGVSQWWGWGLSARGWVDARSPFGGNGTAGPWGMAGICMCLVWWTVVERHVSIPYHHSPGVIITINIVIHFLWIFPYKYAYICDLFKFSGTPETLTEHLAACPDTLLGPGVGRDQEGSCPQRASVLVGLYNTSYQRGDDVLLVHFTNYIRPCMELFACPSSRQLPFSLTENSCL